MFNDPDCMMPDGADPCKGYQDLRREVEQLQAKLHCMCGSSIDHSAWEGHTTVSMYDYALDRAEERVSALERVRTAAQALADHCKKSVNVGPISAAPATEAFLWLDLLSALENAQDGAPLRK